MPENPPSPTYFSILNQMCTGTKGAIVGYLRDMPSARKGPLNPYMVTGTDASPEPLWVFPRFGSGDRNLFQIKNTITGKVLSYGSNYPDHVYEDSEMTDEPGPDFDYEAPDAARRLWSFVPMNMTPTSSNQPFGSICYSVRNHLTGNALAVTRGSVGPDQTVTLAEPSAGDLTQGWIFLPWDLGIGGSVSKVDGVATLEIPASSVKFLEPSSFCSIGLGNTPKGVVRGIVAVVQIDASGKMNAVKVPLLLSPGDHSGFNLADNPYAFLTYERAGVLAFATVPNDQIVSALGSS